MSPNLAFNLFSKQLSSIYGQVFNPNFVQPSDLSAFIHVAIMKFNIIFVCITQFYPDRPDLTFSEITRPVSDLHFFYTTQLYAFAHPTRSLKIPLCLPARVAKSRQAWIRARLEHNG